MDLDQLYQKSEKNKGQMRETTKCKCPMCNRTYFKTIFCTSRGILRKICRPCERTLDSDELRFNIPESRVLYQTQVPRNTINTNFRPSEMGKI